MAPTNASNVSFVSSSGPSPSAIEFPFPSAEASGSTPLNVPRPPYLPFRRISLPSAPNLLQQHRQSVVSVASFDSLPEEGVSSSPGAVMPEVMKRAPKKSTPKRPASLEAARRGSRTRHVRSVDMAREAKRRKVIYEFYETERSYVDGLDLIYTQFLAPIIESLDTPHPLLDRAELTSVFSNFIDIWNLHRSFFSSLSRLLDSVPATTPTTAPLPPLSPVLLSHFPYLSLYAPFVTSFHTAVSALTHLLTTNLPFAAFVARQEADPRCAKLRLRDWLLTIVQRCPRYLLLLKDIIGCTEVDDPEHAQLTAVHTLVSKITLSLNTSLHTHAQTLSLLALQRSTPNLPFQLISPGRTLLKRGALLQVERAGTPRAREFLLFSDCLVWLASADGDAPWTRANGPANAKGSPARPGMVRSRSKSEAELPTLKTPAAESPKRKERHASSGQEERWSFQGKAELVDLEVVVSPRREAGDERRFEILSPETSYAVYADSEAERDEWTSAIRNAKASLLVSLNIMHPDSTLTSSSSNQHLRRSLQALPYRDDAPGTGAPRRGHVEHFVPAIWIPDAKTDACMRCARAFGWRRRRHHCRLCGRCVCAGCSGRTFFISDSRSKDASKPARSCNACYETVFPLLEQEVVPLTTSPTQGTLRSHSTLSGLPSWLTLPVSGGDERETTPVPKALMAIDVGSPKRALHRIDDEGSFSSGERSTTPAPTSAPAQAEEPHTPSKSRIRSKPAATRPRSYHQILQDFQKHEQDSEREASPAAESVVSLQGDETVEEDEDANDSEAHRPVSPSPRVRREDTARRHKRFSLPAVALQTQDVTAGPRATGEGRQKRISLVLSGRSAHSQSASPSPTAQRHNDLGKGVAASRLNELLGRQR